MIILEVQQVELTLSVDLAEFIARLLFCLLFHFVGLTLCLSSHFIAGRWSRR